LFYMDFASLLHHANKNLKSSTKKVNEAHDEISRQRIREFDQIRLQKIDRLKKDELARERREEERRSQFQIPKKKTDSSVDPDRIKAFKAKQEEERRRRDNEEAKKKEELIKLRLAANGGKANKKIAKHFGADVIDLQVKYGQDRDHIETLQKYKERDEEEAERMADHYRGGVAKAFANKKTVEEKVKDGARIKQSGLPKKNLTILSSDGFEEKKQIRHSSSNLEGLSRKRGADERSLDFNSLMKKAATLSSSKEEEKDKKGKDKEEKSSSGYAKEISVKQKEVSSSSSFVRLSSSFKIPKPTQTHSKAAYVPHGLLKKKEEEPLPSGIIKPQNCFISFVKSDKRATKEESAVNRSSFAPYASTPNILAYPTDERGKRILPGDIRYKTWLEEQKKVVEERSKNAPPPPPMTTKDKEREKAKQLQRNSSKMKTQPSSTHRSSSSGQSSWRPSSSLKTSKTAPSSIHSQSSKISKYEEEKRKIVTREERMLVAKKKMEYERREMKRSRDRDTRKYRDGDRGYCGFTKGYDDDEDEDEEDSDLDDFIDDSGDVDDLTRRDFEETLRSINKNYDTKKWKMNERMIDERQMHSNWRQVEKEERASARAGLKEDIREAVAGKSQAL
ncbi:hypothetical protein PFISCL1PPCAC_15591, partial [Pristionchus fissidentatus]